MTIDTFSSQSALRCLGWGYKWEGIWLYNLTPFENPQSGRTPLDKRSYTGSPSTRFNRRDRLSARRCYLNRCPSQSYPEIAFPTCPAVLRPFLHLRGFTGMGNYSIMWRNTIACKSLRYPRPRQAFYYGPFKLTFPTSGSFFCFLVSRLVAEFQ